VSEQANIGCTLVATSQTAEFGCPHSSAFGPPLNGHGQCQWATR